MGREGGGVGAGAGRRRTREPRPRRRPPPPPPAPPPPRRRPPPLPRADAALPGGARIHPARLFEGPRRRGDGDCVGACPCPGARAGRRGGGGAGGRGRGAVWQPGRPIRPRPPARLRVRFPAGTPLEFPFPASLARWPFADPPAVDPPGGAGHLRDRQERVPERCQVPGRIAPGHAGAGVGGWRQAEGVPLAAGPGLPERFARGVRARGGSLPGPRRGVAALDVRGGRRAPRQPTRVQIEAAPPCDCGLEQPR